MGRRIRANAQDQLSMNVAARRLAVALVGLGAATTSAQAAHLAARRLPAQNGAGLLQMHARQYPSDAPACASLCIRVKITEAADPGLATSCDSASANYVSCLCQTETFSNAYDTCLRDNCPQSQLSTARALFSSFCSNASPAQISSAREVASSAEASQDSAYSSTTTSGASGGSTTASSALSTTTAVSGGASTTTTGSAASSTTNTSGATSGTATTSGQSTATSGASTRTSESGSQQSSTTASVPSSSLNAEQVASARANATGVVSAATSVRPSGSVLASLAITAAAIFLGKLAVLA